MSAPRARNVAMAGSTSASDRPCLGQHRPAGLAAAHQGFAHHRAEQPGEAFLRRGVQRGDRERFQQAPVQPAAPHAVGDRGVVADADDPRHAQ